MLGEEVNVKFPVRVKRTKAFRVIAPLDADIVTLYGPGSIDVVVRTSRVTDRDWPGTRVTLVWLKDIVGPDGDTIPFKSTVPEKPVLARDTVAEVEPPTSRLLGVIGPTVSV